MLGVYNVSYNYAHAVYNVSYNFNKVSYNFIKDV